MHSTNPAIITPQPAWSTASPEDFRQPPSLFRPATGERTLHDLLEQPVAAAFNCARFVRSMRVTVLS